MKNKKFIIINLIMILILLQCSILTSKVKAETTSGSTSWNFDSETGVLTFSGNGTINIDWNKDVNKENVKKVVIEDGITAIGSDAFRGCTELTNIVIPNSVTSLGSSVFYNCTKLTSINIPSSVTRMQIQTFWNCPNLISIEANENSEKYCSIEGVLYSKNKKRLICYPAGRIGDFHI